MLAVYVASIAAGIQVVVALLAPYSSYGRMVRGFIGIADGSSGTASIIAAAAVLAALLLLRLLAGERADKLLQKSECHVSVSDF